MPEDYPLVLDSSIAKIIRKAINKPTGEIYKSDVEKITNSMPQIKVYIR